MKPLQGFVEGEEGQYECRCCHCNKRFIGHKREVSCPDCYLKVDKANEITTRLYGTPKHHNPTYRSMEDALKD